MSEINDRFIAHSRNYLTDEYLPKIRAAVESLHESDVWWRPNDASNSIGILLLHLTGNLRQWLVSGLGGAPDHRDRDSEFAPAVHAPTRELLAGLAEAVGDADAVLARLDPATLGERRLIQGRDVTGLEALYHAVQHLSMHAGQIFYIAKLRSGVDLRFYEFTDGVARARWPGREAG